VYDLRFRVEDCVCVCMCVCVWGGSGQVGRGGGMFNVDNGGVRWKGVTSRVALIYVHIHMISFTNMYL